MAGKVNQNSKNKAGKPAADKLSGSEDAGFVSEFIEFLRHNKKWWLTPIFVLTLLLIVAALLLPSPVSPFIYTLF